MAMDRHPVLLFDSTCAMCTALVPWIVRHESDKDLRFGALQSDAARRTLAMQGLEAFDPETMYLIEGGQVFVRSTAVARFARHLRWPWRILVYIRWVPEPVRDGAYRYVAQNRHRWFGPADDCQVLPLDVQARFLG
jgi:predicted DCC family thiol-disulfide oxidoreductase YuxK